MSNDDLDDPKPSKGFPHRQQTPVQDTPVFREMVGRYVTKLLELEAKTHPANEKVNDKDADARMALSYAAKLVEIMAGWALDHQAGLLLNNLHNNSTVF